MVPFINPNLICKMADTGLDGICPIHQLRVANHSC